MKLTQNQITTIRAALQIAEEKWQSKADAFPESTFWKDEAAEAIELHTLFGNALFVEVESAAIHPAPVAPALKRAA